MEATRNNVSERFWSRVAESKDGCWLWTGATDGDGYGLFSVSHSVTRRAHRWAYTEMVGEIPEGLQLDHLCRVRNCVRPEHLDPVTSRVNIMRGVGWAPDNAAKDQCPRGHDLGEPEAGKSRSCRTCCTIQSRIYRGWDEDLAWATPVATAPADRTECLRGGHPFTPENTRTEKNGKRHCRTCQRELQRIRRARAKARKKES